MKKLATLAGCAALCMAFALPTMAEEGLVTVGGHMKGPILTDNVWGDYMVNGVKGSGGYSAGTYFTSHAFILYVSKEISENVSVEAAPDFWNGGAGATPSLGKKLGETLKDASGTTSFKFQELTVKYNLPDYGLQLRAGYMSTPFTMDYGKELFWGEEKDGGKYTLYGGSWHDAGLEVYKPFELGGFSLPAYLYILNGNSSSNRDNNNSRAVMLHVEPQFGGVKTFGSFGTGKWGDSIVLSSGTFIPSSEAGLKNKTFYRWSTGVEYAYKAFRVRGEMGGTRYNDKLVYGANRANYDDFGYYGKVFYTVVPEKLTALIHYDNYVRDVVNGSSNGIMKEKYDTVHLGLNYDMAPSATLMFGFDKGNWRNNDIATKKDYVKFNRFTTTVRMTF